MPKSDPLIGACLAGRFQISQRIGVGGMGTVYRARDDAHSTDVAIKVLKPHLAQRADLLKRFEREARAMMELSHPNIVRLFDYGVEAATGHWFIVMELLEGTPLDARVRKHGPLAPEQAIRLGSKLCFALQQAHARGIVHRDLKPENVFLCGPSDEPKLIDFGLAKLEQTLTKPGSLILTQEGMVFGTPEFMSPEQARGRPLDRRSDVYSLAVILYEALTGKLPFEATSAMEFVRGHVLEAPISLRRRAPERAFPAGLNQVLMKAMAKSRSLRYQSAEQFGVSLNAVLASGAEPRRRSLPQVFQSRWGTRGPRAGRGGPEARACAVLRFRWPRTEERAAVWAASIALMVTLGCSVLLYLLWG